MSVHDCVFSLLITVVIDQAVGVVTSERNRFNINLDCQEFYSNIRNGVFTSYRTKVSMATGDNIAIPLTLTILPFKPGDRYLLICAETDIGIDQEEIAADSISIEASAFNPCRDGNSQYSSYGRLGRTVSCTESLRSYSRKVRFVLDQLNVLQMFMFYCKKVVIDIKMGCN